MKKRKLLFKQIIKCPNWHETICNVYEDNGYWYYECPICGIIVGLRMEGDCDEDLNFIGGKLYKNKVEKKRGFTGYNSDKIVELLKERDVKAKKGVQKT